MRLAATWAGVGLAASMAFAAPTLAAKVGDQIALPEIRLLDGTTIPEGHFKGKPVIVEYWASWCPFCARQNPYVQKLWLQAKEQGLDILTVSIDSKTADAIGYLDKHQYTFPAAMETQALRDVLGKRKVVPHVFVINSEGYVAESIPGEMFEEDVLGLIKYAPAPANTTK
ncbi:TlpA disulfide reductase family protein [Pusillimonas sp. SM2304]|uniref:TlpA disulfide reductase family protein n=1 Tax=Pusillimonas sp. SM2304 TaxID=3073241 RepID=UPI002874824C|nr:TlpA disulfide reductase family protein [Pusillimonas sp. SM2304]MDS1142273.1 TlpA disulfide reductase family protein [Pusillimonas sp. SM2304]